MLVAKTRLVLSSPLYPEGFDNTPEIDPLYGAIYPDNPWEMNLSNTNACRLLNFLDICFDQENLCGTLPLSYSVARVTQDTDSYLLDRMAQLNELTRVARNAGGRVYYS